MIRKKFSKLKSHLLKYLEGNASGIINMIWTCFFASVMISIVRHLSETMHVFQIVMMRNFFALLFFFPYIIKSSAGIFRTKKLHLHVIRGLVGLVAMLTWFYTVTLIPLPEAVSITFITPIITTLAAVIFLKEQVLRKNWIALFVGFAGVLIIVRPGFQEFKLAYLLAFFTACLWATTSVFVKTMTKTEKPETIVVYMCFIIFFFSVPIAAPHLRSMSLHDLWWLALLAMFSNLSHISMSKAYSKTDMSVIQPFDFSRLIFTAIIAYFAFDEVIDFWTVIGSLVILAGSIYSAPKPKNKFSSKVKNLFRRKDSRVNVEMDM